MEMFILIIAVIAYGVGHGIASGGGAPIKDSTLNLPFPEYDEE